MLGYYTLTYYADLFQTQWNISLMSTICIFVYFVVCWKLTDKRDFSVNLLTGGIPTGFCNMSNLEQLYAYFCEMRMLNYFRYLSVNRLSSTIDPCLGNLESLAWVYHNGNLKSSCFDKKKRFFK